jgi:phage anti-repressor protein
MNQIVPKTINFKELVQNSNTTLSLNLQTKLVQYLNNEFTEQEQQWYIANLFIYMNYHPTNDYPINLDNVYNMLGFANKGNAMKTIKNNFTKDEDYQTIIFHMEKNKLTEETRGRKEETVMLNIDTFKNLCMLVKTDKGKQIRKYYVKLENIYNKLIKEEIEEQQKLIEDKDIIIKNNECTKKVEKHKFLIEKFKYKKCIYIADVGKNFRKIGSSKNIETRLIGLLGQYGECLFLDVFECDNFREIEESILKDNEIIKHLYTKSIHKCKNPQEVVQLTNSFTYLHLLEIVNKHLSQAFFLSPDKQLESKKIDFLEWLIKEKNYSLSDIERLSKISFVETTIDDKKCEEITTTEPIGYKTEPVADKLIKAKSIDKIDPETLTVLETYISIGAVVNNHQAEKYEYNQLYRSIIRNTIYKNYRWNYHGHKIQPNVGITKMANAVETIIQLNKDKTEVIKTFSTKKEFMSALRISHKQATKIIENKDIFNGFYYIKQSDCIDMCTNIDITKYNNPSAKKIKQINTQTKEEIIHNSMHDVYKLHGISRPTIRKYISEKKEFCGYLWEYV